MSQSHTKQLAAGILSLFLGGCIYYFQREPVYFLDFLGVDPWINLKSENDIGLFVGSLPSFFHTFAFAMLTAAFVYKQTNLKLVSICLSWVLLNVLFELGQLSSGDVAEGTGAGLIQAYFYSGEFDIYDLLFCVFGGLAAYLALLVTRTGNIDEK